MKKHFHFDITNKRYRSVLILSYGVIAILSVTILITGIFSWFNSYTQKVVRNMSVMQLQNLDTTLVNHLDMCQIQLQTAWQDPDITKKLYSCSYHYQTENRVSRYFQKFCANNGFVDYIGIFSSPSDFFYYGLRYPSQEERSQLQNRLLSTTNDTESFLLTCDGQNYLFLFLTERNTLGGAPQRGLFYCINLSSLEQKIISPKTESPALLVYTQNGEAVFPGLFSSQECASIWDQIKSDRLSDSTGSIILDDSRYLYTSLSNPELGMQLVMIQNYSVMQAEMLEIRRIAFIFVTLSLFITFILAIFFSNKLYYPLQDFFSRISSGAELFEGSESYSQRQAELTSEKIITQIHMLSRQYHSDKVLGYLENNDPDAELPPVLRVTDRNEHCMMILLWSSSHSLSTVFFPENRTRMEELFTGCKISFFSDCSSPCALILVKEALWIGTLSDQEHALSLIRTLLSELQKERDTKFYCALSESLTAESQFRPAYRDLQTLMKYHLLGKSSIGMTPAMLDREADTPIPKKLAGELLEQIKTGQTDDLSRLLSDILAELTNYNIKKVLLWLSDLCVCIEQTILANDLTERQKQEHYLNHYVKITSLYDKPDLENYMRYLIEEAGLEHNISQERTLRMNMLDAIEYIRVHYKDADICVELAASQFHMSVSYFSKLFNEYVGMTFPEFINDLRLTYASEMLLANPSASIKRIAEICGFRNTSYFSSQFRRKYGVSPSSFRNKR